MNGQHWEKSVQIELSGAGLRTVASTDDAARCLSYKWPDRTSKAYHRARGMCLDALEGRKPDEEARQAFIDAARDAHINIHVQ